MVKEEVSAEGVETEPNSDELAAQGLVTMMKSPARMLDFIGAGISYGTPTTPGKAEGILRGFHPFCTGNTPEGHTSPFGSSTLGSPSVLSCSPFPANVFTPTKLEQLKHESQITPNSSVSGHAAMAMRALGRTDFGGFSNSPSLFKDSPKGKTRGRSLSIGYNSGGDCSSGISSLLTAAASSEHGTGNTNKIHTSRGQGDMAPPQTPEKGPVRLMSDRNLASYGCNYISPIQLDSLMSPIGLLGTPSRSGNLFGLSYTPTRGGPGKLNGSNGNAIKTAPSKSASTKHRILEEMCHDMDDFDDSSQVNKNGESDWLLDDNHASFTIGGRYTENMISIINERLLGNDAREPSKLTHSITAGTAKVDNVRADGTTENMTVMIGGGVTGGTITYSGTVMRGLRCRAERLAQSFIIDFGVARSLHDDRTMTNMAVVASAIKASNVEKQPINCLHKSEPPKFTLPISTPPPSTPKKKPRKSSSKSTLGGMRGCNCQKTKCLKLYCECFQRQEKCGPTCRCLGCMNTEKDEEDRQRAILACIDRNPNAFRNKRRKISNIEIQPTISIDEETGLIVGKSFHGCKCVKSECSKRYCECYQSGVACTDECSCVECKNQFKLLSAVTEISVSHQI